MASRSAPTRSPAPAAPGPREDVPAVGGREPCPCSSGRRYKACHGRPAARAADHLVRWPFAGLAGECDWVALREIVPAATAPLRLTGEFPDRSATLATLLPMAWPGLVRGDGSVLVGLQVPGGSGDISRDVAAALLLALDGEPGSPVHLTGLPGPGPRLQDVLEPAAPLEVTVHQGFDFWVDGFAGDSQVAASLERANAAVVPTQRLTSVDAAYWCQVRERRHLRWVLPYDEEPALDALARLHASGGDRLGAGSRYIGSFRAHGLLVPVWDLAADAAAEDVEEPAAQFQQRLTEALADTSALTAVERRARSGLLSRQLTLR